MFRTAGPMRDWSTKTSGNKVSQETNESVPAAKLAQMSDVLMKRPAAGSLLSGEDEGEEVAELDHPQAPLSPSLRDAQ